MWRGYWTKGYKVPLIIASLTIFLLSSCTPYLSSSQKFDKLIQILDKEYIKEINSTKISKEAIAQVLSTLDEHSNYLDAHDLENYLISTKGNYGGIGISMSLRNSFLTIVHTYPNSPAQKHGILPDDIILKINNHPTLGLSLNACSDLAEGKIGEVLQLTIVRKHHKKPLLFQIKREKIKTDPLKSKLFKKNILYVKIPIFHYHVATELKNILTKYTNLKGIILDLRANPGGILNESVSIVDMFIDKGVIVTQKGRTKEHTKVFMAHRASSDTKTNITILIDDYSASASEIVAGALKVTKRATIIGEKSYGKGTVQSLFSLGDNSAVKLTTAKYYLPNGKSIDKIGITPDITIKTKHTLVNKSYIPSERKLKQILKKIKNGSLTLKISKNLAQHTKNSNEIKMDTTLQRAIQLLSSRRKEI